MDKWKCADQQAFNTISFFCHLLTTNLFFSAVKSKCKNKFHRMYVRLHCGREDCKKTKTMRQWAGLSFLCPVIQCCRFSQWHWSLCSKNLTREKNNNNKLTVKLQGCGKVMLYISVDMIHEPGQHHTLCTIRARIKPVLDRTSWIISLTRVGFISHVSNSITFSIFLAA